ncbi:uncharacterized protein PGTG_22609 [Puccinia graminis f. sp. tritici CRL 75-36-700-3]|uniref:Uncharacterized protein n=1 Tax=Puccinia graminis f. sp. tritici (strain CRL 75-36-700-3 / race SCCL) TaxID=418459 RepID=H6QV45_PUCGT|nr:uncharacterized protein PGTG_22609 [Puccinia graminis f. sp. tritici CRL 75-36-700-3]EHS62706.1 hypothetical protein PGTG_22609 [Puccinia graminis f. sp. tritici CRL 75-36-700-3]
MTELMAVVQEECKVWKEEEECLARKEAQLAKALKTANNKPQAPAPPAKGPEIGVPNMELLLGGIELERDECFIGLPL